MRWIVLWAFAIGCNESPSGPAHGYQLQTPQYSLNSGEEKYLCYVVQLNEKEDFAVTSFKSVAGNEVHHFEVFQALGNETPGLNVCDGGGAVKITWMPLFGGGKNAGGLDLPSGAGFKLPKDAVLLLQLHLLNATQTAVNEKVTVNMEYADDATKVTPAGIFALGSNSFHLPAGGTGIQVTSGCSVPKQMNVFAVQPHMHLLGNKIELDSGADQASSQMVYKRDPWVFGAQPIDNFTMPMTQGQYASVTCTFDNTTDHDVSYGESTTNEMCYFVLFYTPFDKLDGCIN